jgi:hypothetical protein
VADPDYNYLQAFANQAPTTEAPSQIFDPSLVFAPPQGPQSPLANSLLTADPGAGTLVAPEEHRVDPSGSVSGAAPAAPPGQAGAPMDIIESIRRKFLSGEPLTAAENDIASRVPYASGVPGTNGYGGSGSVKLGSTSTSSTSGMDTSTPQYKRYAEAVGTARTAGEAAAASHEDLAHEQSAQAREEAAVAKEKSTALADEAKATQALQDKNKEDMAKLDADVQSRRRTYVSEAAKLDPDRLLRSGGNRVMAAIGMALGSFGSALTRTPNDAMAILEHALDRDYQGQKDRLGAKKEDVSLADQAYDRARGSFKDQMAARLIAKGDMREVYASKIEAIAAEHKGTIVEKQGLETAQLMRAKTAEDNAQALAREQQTRNQSSTTSYATAAGGAGGAGGTKPTSLLDQWAYEADKAKKVQEAYGAKKLPEHDATRLNKVLEQASGLLGFIKQLPGYKKSIDEAAPLGVDITGVGDASAKKKALQNEMVIDSAKAASGAAVRPDEIDMQRSVLTQDRWGAGGQAKAADDRAAYLLKTVKASYDGMSDAAKEQFNARYGKENPEFLRALQSGQMPTAVGDAADLGATNVRGGR